MGFERGQRRGVLWEDLLRIDAIIKNFNFNLTNKTERDFENSLSSALDNRSNEFNNKIYTQINRETTVQSVFCFGKKNRPDMTINTDGIAIEVKYIDNSLDGFKLSIGQAIIYRFEYKFAFNVLVISEQNKNLYDDIIDGKEERTIDIIKYLANELNVFTYIVPAFKLKVNQKKVFSALELIEL